MKTRSNSSHSIVLDNTVIWPGDGREFHGHVVIRDGKIEKVETGRFSQPQDAVDLSGLFLSPGLIDLMLLGGFGRSVLRDGPREIAREAARIGVTSVLFCGGMIGWKANVKYARKIREAMHVRDPCAARVLGWYPEGPFLDPKLTAALPEHALPPTPGNVHRMLDEMGDTFPLINVSPGLDGDVEAIRSFVAAGKVVSMAHCNASVMQTERCLEAGTSVLGHFNCNNRGRMDEEGRRVPTIEDVALTDDRVRFIHVICDGVHTDPVFVRQCLRARGIEHLCVVTDTHSQGGCPDGPFQAEDGRTFIKKGPVARTMEGRLVGSAWMLPDQFRNFIQMTRLPPREAIRAVTLNPAASLGLESVSGAIAPGRMADLIAWDSSLRVRRVWLAGREISEVSPLCERKYENSND
ncbi:MAG: amidohydrolase family protein [Verrucomicrobia bacterium]|nr:amidohydrolase family protein [Verrucomicrobiota bacterium]